MTAAPTPIPSGTDAHQTIAGSIKPPPSDLEEHLDGWLKSQRSRRQKPSGYASYRQRVQRFLRESGISQTAGVTPAAVEGWLQSKADRWTGSTYNNALSALGSFTKYLVRVRALASDPLEDLPRAFEDASQGSRAAKTDEAVAILRAALLRQESDERCRGDRALYWACLFLAGCRLDEPGRWRRKHLLLDEPIPVMHWTSDIQKNRREEDCVLAPELLALLLAQREQMRKLAETAPVVERLFQGEVVETRRIDPDDPEAFVFARVPSPSTFRKDRERAGIPLLDARGRRFTPHSARKWFSTTLTMAGVPKEIRDRLMRHKSTVEGRYVDAEAEAVARLLADLPRLWPSAMGEIVSISGGAGLTRPKRGGEIPRRANNQPAKPDSCSTPGPGCSDDRWHDHAASGPGFDQESIAGHPGDGRRGRAPAESELTPTLAMAHSRLDSCSDSTALADLFDSIARLLRGRVAGGSQPQDRRA